jgi:hypothetical protein
MSAWLRTLEAIGSLVLAAWPATRPFAPIIVGAVSSAEDMLNATGSEKKAAALRVVDAGVAALNTAADRDVVKPADAHAIASVAIDALVTTVNVWSETPIATEQPIR